MPVISVSDSSGKSSCPAADASSAAGLFEPTATDTVCADSFAAGSSMKPSRQTAAREKIRFAMLRAPFLTLCMGYYSARM